MVVLERVTLTSKSHSYRSVSRTTPFRLSNVRGIGLREGVFVAPKPVRRFSVGIGGGTWIKWRVLVVDGVTSWKRKGFQGCFCIVVKMGIMKKCSVRRSFAGVRNRMGNWSKGRELSRRNGGNNFLVVRPLFFGRGSSLDNLIFIDDPSKYGDIYQRQCVSTNFIASILIELYKNRGTTEVTLRNTVCEYDGAYGSHVVENGLWVRCSLKRYQIKRSISFS